MKNIILWPIIWGLKVKKHEIRLHLVSHLLEPLSSVWLCMEVYQPSHKMYPFNLMMTKKKLLSVVSLNTPASSLFLGPYTLWYWLSWMNILDFMDSGLIFAADSAFTGWWFHFYVLDKNWGFIKASQPSHTTVYIWEECFLCL